MRLEIIRSLPIGHTSLYNTAIRINEKDTLNESSHYIVVYNVISQMSRNILCESMSHRLQ